MLVDALFSAYIKYRLRSIEVYRDFPIESQRKVLSQLVTAGQRTNFGKIHNFDSIDSTPNFKQLVPLQDYSTLEPYIIQAIHGAKDVLWPGYTRWFAKSSGTTGTRMKTLPVTKESLENNHYAGGKDLLACYHAQHANRKLYSKKHLILGGSNSLQSIDNNAIVADLSAIIIDNLPLWTEFRRVPEKEIVLLSDWEDKLHKMAESSLHEDIAILAGVPSWMTTFTQLVLNKTGKNSLLEVWPNLELYIHGGMSIRPYKENLKRIFGGDAVHFVESYNASEGYFGLADETPEQGLLLLTDAQIYFEFIPMDCYQGIDSTTVLSLDEVRKDTDYAMVISTSAGLWRYIIGDTIRFKSLFPFRFEVTGRTNHFINGFGEKVVIAHVEKAIENWSSRCGITVSNYTVAPYFSFEGGIGGHEWLIELKDPSVDHESLERSLDRCMREVNSDYDTKREGEINMMPLKITWIKNDAFSRWMKKNGKFGGQHKIPRIQNDRNLLEEILRFER